MGILWAGLQTRSSGEYRSTGGHLQHSRKPPALRGLNVNHDHDLKNIFKSAAIQAGASNKDPKPLDMGRIVSRRILTHENHTDYREEYVRDIPAALA